MAPLSQQRLARRRLLLPAAAAVIIGAAAGTTAWRAADASAFVLGAGSAPRTGAGGLRGANALRREAKKDIFQDIIYPPEMMFEKDGDIMREVYNGARDFNSSFWAVILPFAAGAFFIVGISTLLVENGGKPLVDYTPFGEDLKFLRPNKEMNFLPQGAFMSFYGFFGTFVISPFLWYVVYNNSGQGQAEFNKKTRKCTIVRDGEVIKSVDFSEVAAVRMSWTNLVFGDREVYLILNDGDDVRFMENLEDKPKRVLEKNAADLAAWIGCELEIDDS